MALATRSSSVAHACTSAMDLDIPYEVVELWREHRR